MLGSYEGSVSEQRRGGCMGERQVQEQVQINIEDRVISGYLDVPKNAQGVVLFAHGSGSGRNSPRNQYVARVFQEEQIATLLIDLLTPEEAIFDEQTMQLRFNIHFLAERLMGSADWLGKHKRSHHLPLAFYGASTGAAAALVAAAELGSAVKAVVSRGGRPDLAASSLPRVVSPTLLICGGNDHVVLDLNRQVFDLLACEKRLEVVEGATHLFEEEGTLEDAARLARLWFSAHF